MESTVIADCDARDSPGPAVGFIRMRVTAVRRGPHRFAHGHGPDRIAARDARDGKARMAGFVNGTKVRLGK